MTNREKKLYKLCRIYGSRALHWRRKFIGLLPKVQRCRLYEKAGFGSIFEFSKKLAGLSEEQVRRVLNLEKKFTDKPLLKRMLENGEVSVNKLARVASIATKENEEFWATQAKVLPNRALETLVRDEKIENINGLCKPETNEKSVHVHGFGGSLELSVKVHQKLLELQQKGIDINELFMEFLEKRELEIAQEKEKFSAEQRDGKQRSRAIPARIQRVINKQYGTKCSISSCIKESKTIHHTQRFALSKNHDPHFLAPLCEEHHKIAHSIDVKFNEARSGLKVWPNKAKL